MLCISSLRGVAVLAAFASGTTAFASFDLTLILEAGSGGVHRIDPITGATFGNFAKGWLTNPQDMAINQNNGEAYILEDNGGNDRVLKFDYNTGAFKGYFDTGLGSANKIAIASGGQLLVSGSGQGIRRFSTTGSSLLTYGSGNTYNGIAEVNGYVVGFRNNAGVTNFNWTTGAVAHNVSANYIPMKGNLAVSGTAYWWTGGDSPTYNFLSSNSVNAAGFTTNYDAGFFQTNTVVNVAIATGHGGLLFGISDEGSTSTLRRYLPGGQQLGTVALSQVVQPIAMQNVVAPEPGTMLALAGGLALLVRRRRAARA